MTVLSTTRSPGKAQAVTKAGADHALIDDGHVARQVREILSDGADTGARAGRNAGTTRHAAVGPGPRRGVLHRDAVQPVDPA